MFCGLLTSFLIPETKRKTLEELAGETPVTPNYEMSHHEYKKSADESPIGSHDGGATIGMKV